jgi:FKBP-type peptidyl-prolyl cis-trans isomerase
MIKNDDKKTTPKQRIFFIIIAVFLLATTFMLYAGMVLTNKSNQNKANETNDLMEKYTAWQEKYQAEVNAAGKSLSDKYYDTFRPYKDKVKSFNAADVNELVTKDYVIGDGAEIANGTTDYGYSAYYIGWLSDGTIFDSSFDNASEPTRLSYPLEGSGNMIQGWLEGISGMRIGGIRSITIPSVLGYGEADNGVIPANSPLKFIVMLIPYTPQPEMSDELQAEYNEIFGITTSSESADTAETEEAETAE